MIRRSHTHGWLVGANVGFGAHLGRKSGVAGGPLSDMVVQNGSRPKAASQFEPELDVPIIEF